MDIDSKVNQYCGIINSPTRKMNNKLFEDFKTFIKSYAKEFYCIVHDKYSDVEEEETWHFHFVIKTVERKRIKTVINDFVKGLSINETAITVSHVNNWCKACRYLLHLDNPEKYRYDLINVFTSDLEKYESYINYADNTALSVSKIINICETSTSLIEVYLKIGLVNTRNFRSVIRDVWEEVCKGHTKISVDALKILNS